MKIRKAGIWKYYRAFSVEQMLSLLVQDSYKWSRNRLIRWAGRSDYPDSKVHGAIMGPNWVLSAPDVPHIGPMNLAIWVVFGSIESHNIQTLRCLCCRHMHVFLGLMWWVQYESCSSVDMAGGSITPLNASANGVRKVCINNAIMSYKGICLCNTFVRPLLTIFLHQIHIESQDGTDLNSFYWDSVWRSVFVLNERDDPQINTKYTFYFSGAN